MDLEFLKRGAKQFAYQLSKFFPEDESIINHYVCESHVVVLSTKKLYIYYFDKFIDYVGDSLSNIVVKVIDDKNGSCIIAINNKEFSLCFERNKDLTSMLFYYEKYRD